MVKFDQFQGMTRRFPGGPSNLDQVTPDDSNDLSHLAHWVHISQGGSLTVTMAGGQTVTFAQILPGWHALEIRRIHETGTTATGILAGW